MPTFRRYTPPDSKPADDKTPAREQPDQGLVIKPTSATDFSALSTDFRSGPHEEPEETPHREHREKSPPREHRDKTTPAHHPKPPLEASHSLRRRLLILLLFLTAVPGYVALFMSWLAASEAIQYKYRTDTYAEARNLASALDDHLESTAFAVGQIAQRQDLAREIREFLLLARDDTRSITNRRLSLDRPLALPAEYGLNQAEIYVLTPRERVAAKIRDDMITTSFDRPTPIDRSVILEEVADASIAGLFVAEPPSMSREEPALIFGHPIPSSQASSEHMVLVVVVPLRPGHFQVTERLSPRKGLIVVSDSRRVGTVYATRADNEFTAALNALADEFFIEREEDPELIRLPVFGSVYGIGYSELSVPRSLSMASNIPDVRWAVVQYADLTEALESLSVSIWTTVTVGFVLTAIAIILAFWASARIVGPIRALTRGVQHFTKGDLNYRVAVKTGDEIEVLANAANNMADSIRRSQEDLSKRMAELDEHARQLELIHSISRSVNRHLELEKLFQRIIIEIQKQVPCEHVSLALVHDNPKEMVLDFVYPADRKAMPRGFVIPIEKTVVGRAVKESSLAVRLLQKDGKYLEDTLLASLGMKVLCVVPLIATAGPVGALIMATTNENRFGKTEIKILERVSESLAMATDHSRLFSRVARFAEELEEQVDQRTRELREAQAKLVQTEKFAATGAMAANVAHEVNNPLSIIKNYLKISAGHLSGKNGDGLNLEAMRKSLGIIEDEIDRIARIVKQLRMVSKPAKPIITTVDLHGEIYNVSELVQATAKAKNAEITLDLDKRIGAVQLCADYFRQILINLIRNSLDAMENGGLVTIRTVLGKPSPEQYCVEVQDTGCGIPIENLSRIFDPFFTTKGEGKGTGVGLSVCYNLAKTMGGSMEADSVVGQGSTLRLVLPLPADKIALPEPDEKDEEPKEEKPPVDNLARRRRGEKIIIG